MRATKNRFGPTDEVGCFEMTGDGIAEVADPSGLFLSRATHAASAAPASRSRVEGRRALPVEVQALVVEDAGSAAAAGRERGRRLAGGDAARGARAARGAARSAAFDVYVSTVGGIRLTEPGADLAIALAIASAEKNVALPRRLAAIGEISLAGEIRPASAAKQRVTEARRLGYSRVIDESVALVRNAVPETISEGRREAAPVVDPLGVPAF